MKRWIHAGAAILVAACLLPAWAGAQQNQENKVTIAAGTTVETTLTTLLTSKTSEEGDPFSAEIVEPIFSGGEQVIPAGSTLEGHVAFVKPPGRVKGKGEMRLVADRILTQDGIEFPLSAGLANTHGTPATKETGQESTFPGPGKNDKAGARYSGKSRG